MRELLVHVRCMIGHCDIYANLILGVTRIVRHVMYHNQNLCNYSCGIIRKYIHI